MHEENACRVTRYFNLFDLVARPVSRRSGVKGRGEEEKKRYTSGLDLLTGALDTLANSVYTLCLQKMNVGKLTLVYT